MWNVRWSVSDDKYWTDMWKGQGKYLVLKINLVICTESAVCQDFIFPSLLSFVSTIKNSLQKTYKKNIPRTHRPSLSICVGMTISLASGMCMLRFNWSISLTLSNQWSTLKGTCKTCFARGLHQDITRRLRKIAVKYMYT